MASSSIYELQDQEVPFKLKEKFADEIMEIVNKLGLLLKLDKLTKGEGNCVLVAIAIIQIWNILLTDASPQMTS